MCDEILRFMRSALERHGYAGAVIGISGGIDSAVVAALAVRALGTPRVLGVILPERDSAPETLRDALAVCDHLGIERTVKPITRALRAMGVYRLQPPAFFLPRRLQERYVMKRLEAIGKDAAYLQDLEDRGDPDFLRALAYYRVKHRVRMACLYLEAEKRNYAVLGTTNRTEALTGLYVKWGDEAADIEPIRHLYKTQVCELGRELGIPAAIRSKAPSPDLIPGITDELVLGMTYSELDSILIGLERGDEIVHPDPGKVERVRRILAAAPRRALRNLAYRDPP
jgi:NAD+ synthase